jgi:thiol-disulfide isomerase/thioredoxin
MVAVALSVLLSLGQVELEDKVLRLREELRRTLTNGTLMLAQAKNQSEYQKIYEQGYGLLEKISKDALTYEGIAKPLDLKAKFGLVRYEATAAMLQDPTQIDKLNDSFVRQYRESSSLCVPIEEFLFYRYTGSGNIETVEKSLGESKNPEVQASAALARVLKGLLSLEGDPNLLRTVGQQYSTTKAGKRALKIFGLRTKLALGQPMPELELSLLGSNKVNLRSFVGKVVMIDFWGFWSGPSNAERSELKDLAKRHSSKLQIVGVNTDEWNPSFLQTKIKSEGITWPNHAAGLPSGEVPVDYGITEYPAKIIIDEQGMVRYLPGLGSWRDVLEKLLGGR